MQDTLAGYRRLSRDHIALEAADPFTRVCLAGHLHDAEIAARTWTAYRPALPVSFEAAVFGSGGSASFAGATAGHLSLFPGRLRCRRRAPG
ncbi:DUF2937 family protein [Puniceibacterium confluentis]|nr:DUF2937 family protein [Puniceibacterium confluentis]